MAEQWPEKISRITIGKALKRIGFTRKKNLRVQRKTGQAASRVAQGYQSVYSTKTG